MNRQTLLGRIGPWAAVAILLGVLTGVVVASAGGSDSPTKGSTTTHITASGLGATSTTAKGDTKLMCFGSITGRGTLREVAGQTEAGAKLLGDDMSVPSSAVAKVNDILAGGAEAYRSKVLAAAKEHPILLAVLRLDGDQFQQQVARDLVKQSPTSVVVVVVSDRTISASSIEGFPPGQTIAVGDSVGATTQFSVPWPHLVTQIASGHSKCS